MAGASDHKEIRKANDGAELWLNFVALLRVPFSSSAMTLTELVKPQTIRLIRHAGWHEGRDVGIPDRYFESIPPSFVSKREAMRFLREFSGLIIRGEDHTSSLPVDGISVRPPERWVRVEQRASYPNSRLQLEELAIPDNGIVQCIDIMNNGSFSRFVMASDGEIFEDRPDEGMVSYLAGNWWTALDKLLLE